MTSFFVNYVEKDKQIDTNPHFALTPKSLTINQFYK